MIAKRVFIHGGCTSRDAVTFYPDYGFELAGYVARQSLISAYSPSDPTKFNFSKIPSSFQRRMFSGDVAGNLQESIAKSGAEMLVWDLMIERVGVAEAPAGGYVTRNMNFRKIGAGPTLTGMVDFGSDEHFRLWTQACEKHAAWLDEVGMLGNTIINATPWAYVDEDGRTPGSGTGLSAEFFNSHIERYHDFTGNLGIKIINIPQEKAIASSTHQWGPAPFHYVESTYRAALEQMSALVSAPIVDSSVSH